ncbi:MAG: hypothetical protein WC869_13560 [Phycisphaerae bacterium]|jgi:hypothetical protein
MSDAISEATLRRLRHGANESQLIFALRDFLNWWEYDTKLDTTEQGPILVAALREARDKYLESKWELAK